MLLRLLAVIGAGAIMVFVILAVSTLYVVEGEGTQRTAASSPAVDMRDQLRRAATPSASKPAPAPVAPAVAATPPAPERPRTVTVAPSVAPPSAIADAPDAAAFAPSEPAGSERTGSVNPIDALAAPHPLPQAAPQAVDASADEPPRRRALAPSQARTDTTRDRKPPSSSGKRKAPRCEGYRTFNAETRTYRGFDGRVHSCPAG